MTVDEFEEPASLEDGERRRQELTSEVQTIQAQLGDKQRTSPSGQRLSQQDYRDWKKKAKYNLNKKLSALRAVKSWLCKERQAASTGSPSLVNQSLDHLGKLCSIIGKLADEDVEFDPDEQTAIEAAKMFLRRLGANTETTAA